MFKQGLNSDGETIRSAYVEHDKVVALEGGPSLTRQEFAEECDINTLMAKYETTGFPAHMIRQNGQYLDVSDVPDLQRAMKVLADAEQAFMTLPARTRFEFNNDPERFVAFAQDPANIEQMRAWGLAEPVPVDPGPMKVEVVNRDPEPPPAAK